MKEVLAAFPELRRSGPYLYRCPVKEILVGYLVEFPPGGPRLRALRLPLYEPSDSIHLDFSPELAKFRPDGTPPSHARRISPEGALRQLPQEEIAAELRAMWPRKMNSEAERAFACRLISHIERDFDQLDQREDLKQFAASLRPRAEGEPLWRKTLALTLVMLCELREAQELIVDLLREADAAPFSEIQRDDLKFTLQSVEAGPVAAMAYRLDVVKEMRQRFSLVH